MQAFEFETDAEKNFIEIPSEFRMARRCGSRTKKDS